MMVFVNQKLTNWRRKVSRAIPLLPRFLNPERSALSYRSLDKIQRATFQYSYKGRACWKSPFDLALYVRLVEQVRPGTIVEVGSFHGGSALWFAAQSRALGLDTQIISLDINPVDCDVDANVRFIQGDIHRLDESELPSILTTCPRPLLVIEDGPHTYAGSLSALKFFDSYLMSGEYIVIEDGILADLRLRELENGPNRAIKEFLSEQQNAYRVDRDFCDFYGHNVTWNTNGYIVKN
jgi:cephalosporin hydroxylase